MASPPREADVDADAEEEEHGNSYMLPAAATWLPVTFLRFMVVWLFVIVGGLIALDNAGDWAHDVVLGRVSVTRCASEWDVFSASTCSGVDFAGGEPATHTFEDMDSYMRWLRVNMTVYPTSALPPSASLELHVHIATRATSEAPWLEVIEGVTTKPVVCPSLVLRGSEPCTLFNVAFLGGIKLAQYRVTVRLHGSRPAWLRGVELEASHGRAFLGRLDLGVRTVGVAISLIALLLFAREMRPFALAHWLPQQKGVMAFLPLLVLYNDPSRAVRVVDGARDFFAPTLLASLFVSAGATLALVLIDLRHLGAPDAAAEAARAIRLAQMGSEGARRYVTMDGVLQSVAGARSVEPRWFWAPKLALGGAIFVAATSLDLTFFLRLRTDPGATYKSIEGWQGFFAVETALACAWLAYAVRLTLNGLWLAADERASLARESEAGELRSDHALALLSTGYLSTAAAFVLCILGIHLREVARTRVADHPTYSDSSFETKVQNVIVANALGLGLALCFRPLGSTERIRRAGGLRAALANRKTGFPSASRLLRKAKKKAARADAAAAARLAGAVADSGAAPALTPARPAKTAALSGVRTLRDGHEALGELLREYARLMRATYEASDGPVDDAALDDLRELQAALELLPQTARQAQLIKWRYPAFFVSRQEFVWAVIVRDVDSDEGRAFWAPKLNLGGGDGGLGATGAADGAGPRDVDRGPRDVSRGVDLPDADAPAAGAPPPPPSVRALLTHFERLGLSFRSRALETGSGPHVLILLRHSAAVTREHRREYEARVQVETELPVEPPALVSTADKLRAIARLLTDHPLGGQSHVGLAPGELSLRAGDLELVAGSFPLHDRALNRALHAELRGVYALSDEQLSALRDHYGEEIGFYYALLNFSCVWLAPIAALGLLVFLLQYSDATSLYDAAYTAWSSASVLWCACLFVFWRRRANELAVAWHVSSLNYADDRNPHFRGSIVPDELLGARTHAPFRSRAFARTALTMLAQACLLIVLEYCVYAHWVWLNETYDTPGNQPVAYYVHSVVVNSLMYIVLIMYGHYIVWSVSAHACAKRENWPTRRLYERNVVAYVWAFIWLDGFCWSFIIGFVHIPFIESYRGDLTKIHFPLFGNLFKSNDHDANFWMRKHDSTIVAMLSTNQIAGLFAENILPVVVVWALRRRLRRGQRLQAARRKRLHPAAEVEPPVALAPIEQQALEEWYLYEYSTQDDYYDVVLFIGYVATYTCIWPIAPIMSWVNNHIELRTDLIKINRAWRRVVPRRTRGIGSWQSAIGFSVGSSVVLVSAFATIATRRPEIFFRWAQSPAHPAHDTYWSAETGHVFFTWRFLVLFIWEHALGAVVLAIVALVPPLSGQIVAQKIRLAKQRTDRLQERAEQPPTAEHDWATEPEYVRTTRHAVADMFASTLRQRGRTSTLGAASEPTSPAQPVPPPHAHEPLWASRAAHTAAALDAAAPAGPGAHGEDGLASAHEAPEPPAGRARAASQAAVPVATLIDTDDAGAMLDVDGGRPG